MKNAIRFVRYPRSENCVAGTRTGAGDTRIDSRRRTLPIP
jgi:hypothetical protein